MSSAADDILYIKKPGFKGDNIDPLTMPSIRPVYDYWLSLCEGGQIPRRKDFNPMKVARYLNLLTIAELQDDDDWLIKVAGDNHDLKFGYSFHNKLLSEHPNETARNNCLTCFIHSSLQKRLVNYTGDLSAFGKNHTVFVTLFLPLLDNDKEEVTSVIGMNEFL